MAAPKIIRTFGAVKCNKLIAVIMLGMLTSSMPGFVFGKSRKKSAPILERIYQYQREHVKAIDSLRDNVYLKLRFDVERRNPTLMLIPSIYVLGKGDRNLIRESYNSVLFTDEHNYDIKSQVLCGTIRKNRRAIPGLLDFLTPNLYDEALYKEHILSPFNRHTRSFYRYTERLQSDGTTRLEFRPRFYNTQVLNGYAIVETETGRIIRTVLNGEYDMITFRTEIQQGIEGAQSLMPAKCSTAVTFKFLGNRVAATSEAIYQNQLTLPDSIEKVTSRTMMDTLRAIPLSESDKQLYADYDERHKPDTTITDTVPKKENILKKIFWDTIGDNLVTPIRAESENLYFRLSPIVNPLYFSWSHRRGLRYKMKLRSQYTFSAHRYLTFNPRFGYNFKFKEFYFTAPLRMTYNPKRNGYAEIIVGNGNRISNSSVENVIHEAYGDSIDFSNTDIDKFTDNHIQVFNNIMVFPWLDIETGFVYHHRKAINKDIMIQYGVPTHFRSFAPMMGLKVRLWQRGPLISIDWERGMKGIGGSTLDYERWEFDGSWKIRMHALRRLNLRIGAGFYTRKVQNYFVDFVNFRDENLPEGWDDEWSGSFELLSRSVYNKSNYYYRANLSYDSPLMIGSLVPYLGKYIEKERFYLSGVALQNQKPYYEIGYSFTNRYLSIGMFAGFRGSKYQRIGFDFEFELFNRW